MKAFKILIMDDEQPIRNLTKIMLSRHGFEVIGAENADEALTKIKEAEHSEDQFCAVILDLQMPDGRGGAQVLSEIKAIVPNIKAVVSSGLSTAPEMEKPQEYGFDIAVSKPFHMDTLIQSIKTLCESA